MTDEKAEIIRLGQDQAAAVSSGDLAKWTMTLADDIVVQPPDHSEVSGRAAVVAWAKEAYFDPFKMQLDFRFDEIEVLGTWAFGRGRFTVALTPSQVGRAMQEATGKFLNIFRRDSSGSWKYARAGFSFDPPPRGRASI